MSIEDHEGFVQHTPRSRWEERVEEASYEASYGRFTSPSMRRAVETEIIISLAGGITAEHFLGIAHHETGAGVMKMTEEQAQVLTARFGVEMENIIWGGDWRHVTDLAFRVSGGDDEASAYVGWLEARTRNLMRHPLFEPAVRALANALLEQSAMTGRQARQVIEGAIEEHQNQRSVEWLARVTR